MFEPVLKPQQGGAALAAWRATDSDRIQRTMLEYAVKAVHWEKTDQRPSTQKDVLWLLSKINSLAGQRNDAIHSPYAILTAEDKGTSIVPLDFFGNPRATSLAAKQQDLASEVRFYFKRAQSLIP
jgi:hypothetical protein